LPASLGRRSSLTATGSNVVTPGRGLALHVTCSVGCRLRVTLARRGGRPLATGRATGAQWRAARVRMAASRYGSGALARLRGAPLVLRISAVAGTRRSSVTRTVRLPGI
jgi:hypothetical protein